jgi:DNA-binding transcriptional MerR regulator
MSQKASDAFRTISEVAEHLDIPPHVLRFWETKFSTLRPLKRSGGRRYYRPDDVALLERIRDLLYKDGFTIKGAQKHLDNRQSGSASVGAATVATAAANGAATKELSEALASLESARESLAHLRKTLHKTIEN